MPPPLPATHQPIGESPLASTARTSRILLSQLEDLRDTLSARVEQLSGAVERLRSQAGELERQLGASDLSLDDLSLHDSPAVRPPSTSRPPPIRSNSSTRRLSQRRVNDALSPTPSSDLTPPAPAWMSMDTERGRIRALLAESDAREAAELAEARIRWRAGIAEAAAGLAADMRTPIDYTAPAPPHHGVALNFDISEDDFDLYVPGNYPTSGGQHRGLGWQPSLPRRGTVLPGRIGEGTLQAMDAALRNRSWYGSDLGDGHAATTTPTTLATTTATATNTSQAATAGATRGSTSAAAASVPGRHFARTVTPPPWRAHRDAAQIRPPTAPVRRGLYPTNLAETAKSKPIIVRSQPHSPALTITPDDLVPSPPAADAATRTSPRSPRTRRREISAGIRADLARFQAMRPTNPADFYNFDDPTESSLTTRGRRVAEREGSAESSQTTSSRRASIDPGLSYSMNDFERDYYLDYENEFQSLVVAPGTGFAMSGIGSPLLLQPLVPPVSGDEGRASERPASRLDEMIHAVRREEGERMLALAADVERHRPRTPSHLSREVTTEARSGAAAPAQADGTATPRGDGHRHPITTLVFDIVDPAPVQPADRVSLQERMAARARMTSQERFEQWQADRARERANDAGIRARTGHANAPGPNANLNREVRPGGMASSTAAGGQGETRAERSAELGELRERTLAAQVQIEITRERVRNLARDAATGSIGQSRVLTPEYRARFRPSGRSGSQGGGTETSAPVTPRVGGVDEVPGVSPSGESGITGQDAVGDGAQYLDTADAARGSVAVSAPLDAPMASDVDALPIGVSSVPAPLFPTTSRRRAPRPYVSILDL